MSAALVTEELKTVLTVDGAQAESTLRKHGSNIEEFGQKADKASELGKKFGEVIHKAINLPFDASQKFNEVREEVAKLAVVPASGVFRNLSEAESHLDAVTEKLDELRTKQAQFSSPIGAALNSFLNPEALGAFLNRTTPQKANDENVAKASAAAKADAKDIADNYKIVAQIAEQTVSGSEKQGELDKAHLANLRAQSEIYQRLNDPSVEKERNEALDSEGKLYETQIRSINHKHDLIEQELQLRDRILDISESEATDDLKRLATLKAIEESTNRRAANALTTEERAKANQDAKDAGFAVETEQRRQFKLNTGEGAQEYRQQQRDEKHARAVFDARKMDYEYRKNHGAYGQSGSDAEIFGANDSSGKTIGDLYDLTERIWDKN